MKKKLFAVISMGLSIASTAVAKTGEMSMNEISSASTRCGESSEKKVSFKPAAVASSVAAPRGAKSFSGR